MCDWHFAAASHRIRKGADHDADREDDLYGSAVTPNTQVGDIVYVKELDSGAHAIGEVDRIYAHGVHMDLYMAKRVSENTFEVSRRLYPEFFNMHMATANEAANTQNTQNIQSSAQ